MPSGSMHWFITALFVCAYKWTKQTSYLLQVLHSGCWIMWVIQITDVLQLYSRNYILIRLHYDPGFLAEVNKREIYFICINNMCKDIFI